MLIKELEYLTSADIRKLGDYAYMSIDQYISEIESKLSSGIRINDFYKKLYNRLKIERPIEVVSKILDEKSSESEVVDPISHPLSVIPLEYIQYYVPSSEYTKTYNRLVSEGITNLYQLSLFEPPTRPKLAYADTAKKWKEIINSNYDKIITEWGDFNTIHIIPSSFDEKLGLIENLRNALIEYANIIKDRKSDRRYKQSITERLIGDILPLSYIEGKDDDEIAKMISSVKDYTPWHIMNVRKECVRELLEGKTRSQNVSLHPYIVDVAKALEKECMFKSIQTYEKYSGSNELNFLSLMGFDLVDVGDGRFLVPLDQKGIYEKVTKAIIKALLDTLLPIDMDTISQMILSDSKLDNINYEQEFVNNVLLYPKLVDVFDNGTIQIKDKFLTRDPQRFIRIIYNAKEKITTKEVKERYEMIYKSCPSAGPSTNSKYGICCESKRLWYYGEPLIPIKECISEYAEENKVFYYFELEQYLLDKGYSISKSIRTQITDICSVDNKDNNHFCHKDYVEDYPEFSWRNPTQYGQTNWILNVIRDILNVNSPVEFSSLVAQLKEKAVGTEYEDGVKKNAKYYIPNYCGEQHPFKLEKGLISKNEPYFSETDYATIGLREGKYPFFSQIRSIAFNEVKRSEEGRKTLNEIIDVVNEIIEEHIGRNVVIRALEDKEKRFEPIDIELITENGNRYVVWTGKEIKAEPTFEVVVAVNKEDGEQVNEVVEIENKPSIKFRQSVNWDELGQTLKRELTFCRFWMIREDYELDESIDKFLNFLRHTNNNNLNKKLPQNLYEYWFASTDSYDRSTYLTNLALFFEALLAEIYYQQHGIKLHKRGLSEWAEEFDGLPQKLLYSRDNKGFDRIASDLHFVRNKIAHGDDIAFSSWETAKTITEYVALYVYVIARYYH